MVLGGPYRAMSSALKVVVRWGASGEFDVPHPETCIVGADLPDVQGIAGAWHRHYLPDEVRGSKDPGWGRGWGIRPRAEASSGGGGWRGWRGGAGLEQVVPEARVLGREECGGAHEPLLLGGRGNRDGVRFFDLLLQLVCGEVPRSTGQFGSLSRASG